MTGDAESKVLLTLEDGVLVAKRYQWVGGGIVGIAALREDGASRLFVVDENPQICPGHQGPAPVVTHLDGGIAQYFNWVRSI